MTRLTNAFSKKWANLKYAYALWFAFYNFCRTHKTLRVTPAMESGLTDHQWTIAELIGVPLFAAASASNGQSVKMPACRMISSKTPKAS
jgi:hypothetical protein